MNNELSKKQAQLQNHASNKIKQFNSLDKEAVRPYSSQIRKSKQNLVSVRVPAVLQNIAADFVYQPVAANYLPNTLVTTRLHPTSELPDVYKNGLVEGNNACWRDVYLRGHVPGPIVRQNTSAHFARATVVSEPGQAVAMQDSVSASETAAYNDESLYQNVGILMRNDVEQLKLPPAELEVPSYYYPDKASVKTVVDALKQYDMSNPYQIDGEMRRVIRQIQRDIYNLRELCKNYKNGYELEEAKELSDRIYACRYILLMDMNDGFLDLEDFDAEAFYEIHTPQEWVDKHSKQFIFPDGRELIGIPAYSRYLYKDRIGLEPVVVTGYNADDRVWHIYWVSQNTQYFAIYDVFCDCYRCRLIGQLNTLQRTQDNFTVYSNAPAFVSPAEKAVKRLNLLFADEDERMWWERRWLAHYTRRIIEAYVKQELFLQSYFAKACRIREYVADPSKTLDFKVTRLLEILSDVAGPTSEIIDNIFHRYVLDNDAFYKSFISKIDEQSYERMLAISQRLVGDVTENLLLSNMLAVVEYLRRDKQFDLQLQQTGLSPARFLQENGVQRDIATVSAEFQPDAICSLMNFSKRRARLNIISLQFSSYYRTAYECAALSIQRLLMTAGIYFFNFAAIIPFIARDQINLIVAGFCGGITSDQESYSVQLALPEQQKAHQVEEVVKRGGLRIRIQQEAQAAPQPQETAEITTIPFYAHPQAKNLDAFGTVSPGLPLSLEQFINIADGHRERLILYFQDYFLKDLAQAVGKRLRNSGIEIVCLDADYQRAISAIQYLGPDGADRYSVERDVQSDNSNGETTVLDFCTDKPRARTLFDLYAFCKFVNLRYYDVIMSFSDRTTRRFIEMLNYFRVENCVPYAQCISRTRSFLEKARSYTLSEAEMQQLMSTASEQLFRTRTVTVVDNSILRIFVSVEPYIRDMRSVSAHDANFIPPSNQQFFADISNFKNIADQLFTQIQQHDQEPSTQDSKLTFDYYYAAMKAQNSVCQTPTLMNLECALLPSVQQIHSAILNVYSQLVEIAPYVRKIDTTFPCLYAHCSENNFLPGPDAVHDPWLDPRKKALEDYLAETYKGPQALFVILQLVIRNLFFVDPFDYVEKVEGVFDYEVKVLPPLDEFNDIDALENDITNPEDQMLINCKGWDYELPKPEPELKKKKSVTIEHDTDDEDSSKPTQEEEQAPYVRVKINNTKMSLRDLRRFLQLYTAIREFLKQLSPQTTETIKNKQEQVCKISFGLYSVDITNVVDILIKRANFLRAYVIRIIQYRLVKMANSVIDDWKLIQEKMNTDCKTPAIYAEIKQFLANIHNTIKSMQGKQVILDRYMAVCEEFGTGDKDFVRILYQYYTWFYTRAAATSYGGYNKLNEHYRDRLSKTLIANLPEKNDDRFWTECVSIYWKAKYQPKMIISERDGAEVKLLQAFQVLSKRKDDERGLLAEQLNSFIRQTVEFSQTASLTNPKYSEILAKLQEFYATLKKRIDTFLLEEKYLALPATDFSAYEYAVEDFSLFNELWTVVVYYQAFQPIWLSQGDFMNINPKDVTAKTAEWTSSLQKLNKQFVKLGRGAAVYSKPKDKDRSACCADAAIVCQDVMQSIDLFIVYIPLIEALRNPGLKPTHWAEISQYTKNHRQISPEQYFTLQVLLDEGLMEDERLENIIRISDLATRQSLVDYQLLGMLDACKAIELEMKLYATDEIPVIVQPGDPPRPNKLQRYFIVRQFDDAMALLDEQFSIIYGLRASQFGKSKEFKTRIDDHDANLNNVQDIIDEWLRFYRLWLYLYPIFTAEDIKRQLPTEAILFYEVCVFWAEITCETNNSKKVWAFASKREVIPKFYLNFQKLENVNKQLSSYLQSKRMSFSRFFFLADEELLQILAQTKNIENVQQHIQKCFEGIKRITFYDTAEGKKITQMVSPEGEQVDLFQPFLPQGDADIWLNEIEKYMKLTVKDQIKRAWDDYAQNVENVEEAYASDPMMTLMGPRELWLSRWSAQVVNVLSYVAWTYETQRAIDTNNCLLLLAEQNNRIDRLVMWVGCTPETVKQYSQIIFNKAIRTLLTTLLTLWVHNRDIIYQLMKPGVDHDFLFASQLKYYYNRDQSELAVKQVDAVLYYYFEYLGNHSRLAITPLTDRCFLTLTSALAKTFGGNPLGPAGTGKSESVKDLAKSLAIGCYIFNCSEGLNEQSISKFFCGLCICGMYSCLDEFNRCRLDVLSVVASYILTIQRAIRANKKAFTFEGLDIRLNNCCGIFITMNPGYAGRAELPTNLKNLFRPIAMTVPDYVIIAEILLFASGYRQASSLAVKICYTLKLASEQLSKASHYDFGMRALKSILNAAARLKRLYWQEREDILCLRAVSDVNVPKFLAADVALYNNIVSDLFMECYEAYMSKQAVSADYIFDCPLEEIDISVDAEHLLQRFVREQAKLMHLTPTPYFMEKVMQLYATMSVRHGLMNVGGTMTGKTTAVRVLGRALGQMRYFLKGKPEWCAEKFSIDAYPHFFPVQIHKLNAKSITSDELYGQFSDVSYEWQDGIICTIMRACNEEYYERKLHFILFDAPVDAIWIENLNTVLDDAKRLCLTSGEVIALPETTTCMFEVQNLEYASPATVSRCGMIYYDSTVVDAECMFEAVCYDMLPYWFMQLQIYLQATWPVVHVKKNSPLIYSAADLTVQGKYGQDGNISLTCYEAPTMTVLQRLVCLFKWTFLPIYQYVYANSAPIVFQTKHTVLLNLVRIMQAYVKSFNEPQKEITITDTEAQELKATLPPLADAAAFVDSVYQFALTWSLGALGDQNGRKAFGQSFRHLFYDIPQLLIVNGAASNVDFSIPGGKLFSSASIKMAKSAKDAIDLRAADFGTAYRKLLKDDIVVWRVTASIPFAEDSRQKGEHIKLPHDVCLNIVEDKNNERGKGLLTPFDVARGLAVEWIPWKNSRYAIPEPDFKNVAFFNDIIVPTQDIVSLNALASMLCAQGTPILFAGPSGSGKTTLAKLLMKQDYISVKCCLTAKTTTGYLRSLVDTKLEKMRKGVYSLSKLKKSVFFVDDSHMPQKEVYEAYPPLEVLRELLEEQGWYDIEQGFFKKIVNTSTIMGATTNGELLNLLPQRLMHHVMLISVPESSDDAFYKIFNKLLSPFLHLQPSSMNSVIENIVLATIALYRKIRTEFKPTPSHMHYLFGPRDLSKVFYGLLLTMKNANIDDPVFRAYYTYQYNVVGLWVNECMRIFADRLINDDDAKTFAYLLYAAWNEAGAVNIPLDRVVPEGVLNPMTQQYEINFGIALYQGTGTHPPEEGQTAQAPSFPSIPYYYININGYDSRVATMQFYEGAITVFNKNKKLYDATGKMDLILFKYALTHVVRITRMLQIDRGHGLLIGMPSSGKRSLTRLAAAALYDFYVNSDDISNDQELPLSKSAPLVLLEPNGKGEFMDKIRQAVKISGVRANPCLLVIPEALADNYGLECINFLVNLGEIPNLFNADDKAENEKCLMEELKTLTKQEILQHMAERVVRNLHIIITVTPGSQALDNMVTYFPSLLGSMSVDWFTPWQEDTLQSIAYYYLKQEEYCDEISKMLVRIHRDTEEMVTRKYSNLCTSPATFLSLIANYQRLKRLVMQRLQQQLNRYTNGVQCLQDTEKSVVYLRYEQSEKQPILQKAQQEVSALAKQIDEKRREMAGVREVLSQEEYIASKAKAEADTLAASCYEDLDRAQPLIDRASKALSLLKASDVNEVRSFTAPSKGVRLLGEVLCIVRDVKISTAPDADNWPTAQKVLRANGFLNILKGMTELSDVCAYKLGKTYINNPDFTPKIIAQASAAAAGICEWVHALYEYYVVMVDVKPKQARLRAAQAQAKTMSDALEEKQRNLKQAEEQLAVLEKEAQKASEELTKLSNEYEICCNRLKRAEGLISGLSGEQVRWGQEVSKIQNTISVITPTALLATAYCACLGGLEFVDRDVLIGRWTEQIINCFMQSADEKYKQDLLGFKLPLFIADQPTISKWLSNGLSKDSFSLTSASIAFMAYRVPLLIDPQQTGKKWASLTLISKDSTVKIARYTDQNLHKQIETALRCGYSLVIEGIGSDQWLRNDPRMKSAIVAHNLIMDNPKYMSVNVRFGESDIIVPNTFRLCLIATFDITVPADIFGDFSIVTFKATREALTDLLISVAVECENPEAENSRKALQASIAESQSELLELETSLLNILSSGSESGQSLLDNVNLMNALNNTQQRSQEISRKMVKSAQKTAEIEEARQVYNHIAGYSATLFFSVLRLTSLDSMYDNSLQNFIKIYIRTINENQNEQSADDHARLRAIFLYFAERIYQTVSRGLFVQHKLTFSLDIAVSLALFNEQINQQQFDLILAVFSGNVSQYDMGEVPANRFDKFRVAEDSWHKFAVVCKTQLIEDLNIQSVDLYEQLFSDQSYLNIVCPLSYLLFCACVKQKDLVYAAKHFITEQIGAQFVQTEAPQLNDIVDESISTVPTLILLSADSDPSNRIVALADYKHVYCHSISIGKGQGLVAEKAIQEAAARGQWVLIGNTHLAGEWLTRLESIIESIADNSYDPENSGKPIVIHRDFRLFLTTMPFEGFPSQIVKAATKVSAEAPIGVKNNFGRLFNQLSEDQLQIIPADFDRRDSDQQQVAQLLNTNYRRLLWNLSLFFSATLERRRFGSVGYSTKYDWSDPDFIISQMQLHTLFTNLLSCKLENVHTEMDNMIKALKFLISYINAGGRVSDAKDQLIVDSMMDAYYHTDLTRLSSAVDEMYGFSEFKRVEGLTLLETTVYNGHARFADLDMPELFGLDDNASILLAQNTGRSMLESVLQIYATSNNQSVSPEQRALQTDTEWRQLQQIISDLPPQFNQQEIEERYPTNYLESMNTVLSQECARYSKLIQIIEFSCVQAQKVLKGLILKTYDTECVLSCLRLNRVPAFWEKAAWPSLKPLSTWLIDLKERVQFIRKWTDAGVQRVVWFSGFSYPQAFLTGTLQNYARRQKIPIDQLVLDFKVLQDEPEALEEGAQLISGLFLQGGSLSGSKLVDSLPGELFVKVPFVLLSPCSKDQFYLGGRYRCPVYRTTERKGVLTTTGHSSNYIMDIFLESDRDENYWIRRGTAMVQQCE